MIVWRICKRKWATAAFNGVGASENPGRWNTEGHKAVYCAESRALAALEIMVNSARKKTLLKPHFVAIPLTVPDNLIARPTRVPSDWDKKPAPDSTRAYGDRFLLTSKFPVMKVPSVAVRGEFCYIINPEHAAFHELEVGQPEDFQFDSRAIVGAQKKP